MEYNGDYQARRKSPLSALFWIFTVAAALVIMIVFAVPILLDQAGMDRTGGLTVAEVVDNPQRYAGQVIALQAEVDDDVGQRGFTLDGPGVVNDELLVMSRKPLVSVGGDGTDERLVRKDDEVIVSGTVRQFEREELEQELGVRLSEEEYENYEGKFIFVADTITPVD